MAMPSRAELLALDVSAKLQLIDELWNSIANDPSATSHVPLTDDERLLLEERLADLAERPEDARQWADVRGDVFQKR